MTTFTKVSNYIFRGTIAAALGATAVQIISGGKAFGSLLSAAGDMAGSAADAIRMNPSHMLTMSMIVTLAILSAAVLSCLAFKASGKVSSVFRTITLFGLAGFSALGAFSFYGSNLVARVAAGAGTAAEIAAAKPLMEVCTKNGYAQDAAAGVFGTLGTVIVTGVAVVLAVLTITSIVSVVKTARASKAECCAA